MLGEIPNAVEPAENLMALDSSPYLSLYNADRAAMKKASNDP